MNSSRIYSVNGKKFKLKKDVVDRLLCYNKSPTSSNNSSVDKTFVELLLPSTFSVNNLKLDLLDTDVLNMIKGIVLSQNWTNISIQMIFFP